MPRRSARAGVLVAVVIGAAACSTTVGGTALPVTGLDTSPPSTSATSSTTSRTTTPRTTTSRTTSAAPTAGGGTSSLSCSVLMASTSLFFTDYNSYVDAVNGNSPDVEAKKAAAVTSTQAAVSTLTTFPVSDPAVSGPATAMGQSLQVLVGLLPGSTDQAALNAAADDVNARYGALKTACGG